MVHGYRTSSRTYGGGGDGSDDEEYAEEDTAGDGGGGGGGPGGGGWGGKSTRKKKRKGGSTAETAVKRKVEAFRRGLGLTVIAELDALIAVAEANAAAAATADACGDGGGGENGGGGGGGGGGLTAADDAWEAVNTLPAAAFIARAVEERRASHPPPHFGSGKDAKSPNGDGNLQLGVGAPGGYDDVPPAARRRKGGGRGGLSKVGRAARCRRTDKLSVDEFIAHLTSGDEALGRQGQCQHRVDIPARELRLGSVDSPPLALSPATVAALAATGVPTRREQHQSTQHPGQNQRGQQQPLSSPSLSLFSHQSRGVAAALAGRNVVVAMGTLKPKPQTLDYKPYNLNPRP